MSEDNNTVLVVDDSDDIRSILRRKLELMGYHVIEAVTGQEAVEVARNERPDLILMDINLPLIDGVNATNRIRAIREMIEVPIVAVSAYDIPELRDSAQTAGCNNFIAKPIDFDYLEKILDRLLPLKRIPGE